MPLKPNFDQQIENLNTQVANLQTLVNTLQNQQTNPSTTLPQSSFTSKSTSIPTVSQVVILSQNSMPTGIQVSVGFTTPLGVMVNLIDHYNVWFQTGAAGVNIAPTVIVSTKKSPCIFTIPSINGTTPGIVGVQTVMRDGQILPFPLCPTTALTVSTASNLYTNIATGSVALTAATPTNIGTAVTVPSAGTYLVWLNIQVASAATGAVNFTMNKNGSLVGSTFTQSIANNNEDILNIYSLALAANDSLQAVANVGTTGNYFFTIQYVLQKQFVS